jgi:hypothetical protein
VPDFFFQDFHNQDAGKESEGDGNAPTLFVEEKADGTYRMRAESKGGDGQQQVDVFENIKLGGTGDEFALVGAAPVNPSELKAMAAEGALREILFTFNTGNEPPPMPTWTDLSCDPVQLVNNIITTLGREPYDNSPIFQQMGGGNFPKPTFRANGVSKPLCSAVSGSGSTLLTIKDFCFESDGITLKKQTVTAAKMICQVAKEAGPVNYWNAKLKDDKGEPVKSCIKESNNKWGTGYRREFVDQTQAQCDASRLASMTTPPSDGSWMNYDWRDVERNMNLDCSELRVAKVKLKECQFNFDVAVEPSFTQPSYDEQPQPDRWWDGKFTLVDAAVAIDEARSKKMNGGGMSPLDHVKQQIDMCSANFDRTVKELNNRRAKIDGITTAVSLIATTKNAAGNLKYIKENADGFVKKGDFSFTSDQVAKLQAVLKKAVTSLDGWADSIKKIKDTYMVIKNAALKAEADDSHKCVADEIGSKAAFTTIYVRFDQAYNGVTNDKTSRGLKNWQEIALNHFQCMDMDQNLLRIRNFGISAPISGIEDSNASAANAKEALLTAEAATCDFTDGRGRCIKNIACQIPAGAETYVPFNTLLDKGEIEAGCEGVTQKVAMMGRVNAHDHKVNSIEVPAGQLVASVLLMTSMPKKSCSLTLKVPSMDKDSCFVYANAEGKSWGELTADERKAATASDYSLAYDSKKVPMLNIANREVIQVMLTPNSDVPTLKETEVGTVKSDSGNSDLDSLIQLDK